MPPLRKQRKQVAPTTEQRQQAAARQEAVRIKRLEQYAWRRFAELIDPDNDAPAHCNGKSS